MLSVVVGMNQLMLMQTPPAAFMLPQNSNRGTGY